MASQIESKNDRQLVDNELAMNDAISELNEYKQTSNNILAIDCQGVSLSRKGELTTLSIASREKVYIFDVLAIGKAIFNGGLQEILEDSTQEKLMYDCRPGSDVLWHQFNVKLDGVLDLQLLEVMYRRENATSAENATASKFGGYKRRSQLTDEVEGVHKYRRCLTLYAVEVDEQTQAKGAVKRSVQCDELCGDIWKARPMSSTVIPYCVVNTTGMFKLYDKMKHILSNVNEKARLKIASGKYLEFYREKEERSLYDDYESNEYLPLDIIPEKGTTAFPSADTSCTRCKRRFPREEFSKTQLRNGKQKCRVCKEVKCSAEVKRYRDRRDNEDCIDFPDCGNDYCFTFGCSCH